MPVPVSANVTPRRRWPILAFGCALFCVLYLTCGLLVERVARGRGVEIERLEASHRADDQTIESLRREILNRSVLLRQYLTSPEPAAEREELLLQRNRIGQLLKQIEAQPEGAMDGGKPGREALARLHKAVEDDTGAVAGILAWSPAERRARARAFLAEEYLPQRDRLARLLLDISTFQRVEHEREYTEIRAHRRFVQWLVLAYGLAGLGGALLLGFFTVFRVMRLENENAEVNRELAHGQDEMRLLSARLAGELEWERKALSRELHDEIGQSLTALRLELSRLELLRDKAPAFAERLAEIRGLIDGAMRSIRSIAMGLRPPMLDDCGLVEALRYQAREFENRTGIPAAVEVTGDCEPLPDAARTALYRIAQEALTNCARHSLARHVWIALECDSRNIRLRIRDDGVGISHAQKPGLGLVSMTERARELGGAIIFDSRPGEGFQLHVELPAAWTPA